MKIAFFDCFSGASGDMIVGAFIDAGLDLDYLKNEISKLNLAGYEISARKTLRQGISGTKFSVNISEGHHHRGLKEIEEIIISSGLVARVKERALKIFKIIADAESAVHNIPIGEVHFHEVGAVDSIIDVTAACIAAEYFGIDKFFSSPLPAGSGFAETEHGIIPIPAPATIEILKGAPIYDSGIKGELVTPTGAAIIKSFSSGYGGSPMMKIEKAGYGAGTKNFSVPNLLRVMIGESAEGGAKNSDSVLTAETNIDDMNPEFYGFVIESLLAAGALDAIIIPAVMKKGRPGVQLQTVFHEDKKDKILDVIFRETTTAGIRIQRAERVVLQRRFIDAKTEFGTVRVKILEDSSGGIITVAPEYEECRRAAVTNDIPVRIVYDAAKRSAEDLSMNKNYLKPSDMGKPADENPAGMVHIYTGRGKGKTTAALGLILRAAGQGFRCRIIRFMKGRDSGELRSLGELSELISVRSFGLDEFYVKGDRVSYQKHLDEAESAYDAALKSVSEFNDGLLVLDEIITACTMGLLDEDKIIRLIENRNPGLELVLTGTGASEKIIGAADLVTEMNPIKHYFDKGVSARRGIEF